MTYNLKLTNSFTRQKELFKPLNSKKITMYACGPTVYDNPHVGNARTLVVFDILYRLLKIIYEEVNYVRNITDVDDKIIEASKKKKKNQLKKSPIQLLQFFIKIVQILIVRSRPKNLKQLIILKKW
jgi:cysteinyl-tRNA synthetase